MDPLTHALASYTLKRAAFPRLASRATIAMVAAGSVADIDMLSRYFGPAAYLAWHRTYFDSLTAAIVISILAALPFFFLRSAPEKRIVPAAVFTAALAAGVLHVLFDACQAQGVELFWPVSSRRFAADWIAGIDFWIPALLLAALILPKLSSLVTEEIGAKSKGPRGRVAAFVCLALVGAYIGTRAMLHASAVATLNSRTYRGESPRRTAAFPDTFSMFTWDGIVETERALHEIAVSVSPAASFDADAARTLYKPEPSPALTAALQTAAARRFLAYARFPKASVEKTSEGYRVLLRTFPYDADATGGLRFRAVIDTDASGKVLDESIEWEPGSQQYWWR